MRCNDCIHEDVCKEWYYSINGRYGIPICRKPSHFKLKHKSKRKFTWDMWDFDGDGSAYIIAKDECPEESEVPDFICREDRLHEKCKSEMVVEEGWCKYQVRSDWLDLKGKAMGSYVVEKWKSPPLGKERGWFPVWIVRLGERY